MANDVIPSAVSLGARNLYRTGVDGPTIEMPRGRCAARHDKSGRAPGRRRKLNGPARGGSRLGGSANTPV